jgi:hypothetical protein
MCRGVTADETALVLAVIVALNVHLLIQTFRVNLPI